MEGVEEHQHQHTDRCQDGTCVACKEQRGAWIIAGAVLLGALIIAASLLVTGKNKGSGDVAAPTPGATADAPQQAAPTVTLDQIKALFTSKNLMFGNKNSKVLFVEFSDPSCPYCHIAAGKNPNLNKSAGAQFTMVKDGGTYLPPVLEMKKLVDSGKAAFVWLYANGHGSGEVGTKALYCANEKGKFWEAHDLLMSETGYTVLNNDVKNDKAKSGVMAEFLKSAVSVADMQACLESGKYDNRIAEDMAVAQQLGFRGTPNFFVNETNYPGAVSFKDMQPTVDKYLK